MNTSFNESEKKERLISLLRKFEQELQNDNNEKVSNKRKWFSWHWFPEEPIKLNSVVEMTVFLLICIGCFFLYYRWNTVPNKEFEIQIEDLSNGVVYDSTRVQVDSVRRVFACNINYNIPMTSHDEFVEGLKSCTVDLSPLYSDDKHSDFLDYTFLNDSIRNGLIRNDSCTYPLLNKYNLSKLFEYKFRFDSASTTVNRYRKGLLDSLNVSPDSCIMVAVSTKESLPFFTSMKRGWQRGNNCISHQYISDDRKYIMSDGYHSFDNRTTYRSEPGTIITIQQSYPELTTFEKFLTSFNFYAPFISGGTMTTPPWGRLEDISQAYITLKLESYTIDSIVINLNFVGATEFSQMDPIPDKVGMSNIIFNDPVKIYKIKANGLRFHARFIELENWQQIRVFTVTAIMSAFVLIFVVFAISSYFKIRNNIRGRGGLKINKSVYWFFIVFIGLILYTLCFWTLLMFAIEGTNTNLHIFNMSIPDYIIKCNLLAIPITVLILLLTNHKGRNFLVKIITSRYFKDVTIYLSICLFFVLFCFALVKVLNMDYDTLMKYQKYNRATKQIYSELCSKNMASKDDVSRLRQALLSSGEPIWDAIEVNEFEDDLLVPYVKNHKDSLYLFDLQNGRFYRYHIPQPAIIRIYDGSVFVNHYGHSYILKRDNNRIFRLFDMGEHYVEDLVGLTDNNETAIFYGHDTITYTKIADKTNYRRLPFSYRFKGFFPKKVADNYIISGLDSFYVYKVRDSLRIDLSYEARSKNNSRMRKIGNSENVYFLNAKENLLLYKNNNIEYLVDLTTDKNYIDSLPKHYWKTEIKPSPLWNRKTINVLKRASAENNITYMGLDNTCIYLYNFRDTCVEAYNKGGNVVGKLKLNHYDYSMPILYSNNEGSYFVQMQPDSIYKYSMDGLVDKKPINRYASNFYINDYIIEVVNKKIIVRPYANPSDSFVVRNIDGFGYINSDYINIINGWMVLQDHDGYHNRTYIENVRSTNSLIHDSKYLTKGQKNRLIGILNKEED